MEKRLHFDHIGGALTRNNMSEPVPTFPNATYWTTKEHYEWAMHPNSREKASFLKENFVPLMEKGVLQFIELKQDIEWLEGIKVKFFFGHTEAMMLPVITLDNGKKIVFMADLLPSVAHIRMPYVMSYDIRPLQTLKEKKAFYDEAIEQDYYLFLEHDRLNELCTLSKDEKGRFGLGGTYTILPLI